MRPQHASGATIGANPFASSTSTTARAPASSRVWLNESAHTSAYGRPLGSRGPLRIGESGIDEAVAPSRSRATETGSELADAGTLSANRERRRAHAVKVPDWRVGMPRRGSRPMMRKASERRGVTDMAAFAMLARPGTRAVTRVRRGSQPSV